MGLHLLFYVLCLMAPTGYSQLEGLKGPKGEKGDPGMTGSRGIPGIQGAERKTGIRGVSGNRGVPGLLGPPGPVVMCGRDIFGSLERDVETLKKTTAKLALVMNFYFVRKVGQKYFVSNKDKGSFSKAVEFCSQQGLELALPQSEEENSKLTQLWGEVDEIAWINVNNKKAEGNFKADMNSRPLTFTKWGEAQPDKSIQDTGCSMLSDNGNWRVTHDCSLNAYIICQL